MGIFDLFNNDKAKWLKRLNGIENNPTPEKLIVEFFIRDNINLEVYIENNRANQTTEESWGGGLEGWEQLNQISMSPESPIKCSKTFRNHFSRDRTNRGQNIPEWFYIAYPDVAYWFHCNWESFKPELVKREQELFGRGSVPTYFFRELIDRYKKIYGKLECTS